MTKYKETTILKNHRNAHPNFIVGESITRGTRVCGGSAEGLGARVFLWAKALLSPSNLFSPQNIGSSIKSSIRRRPLWACFVGPACPVRRPGRQQAPGRWRAACGIRPAPGTTGGDPSDGPAAASELRYKHTGAQQIGWVDVSQF